MGFPRDPLSGAAICPCVPASSPYPGELTTPLSPLTSVARALPSRCPAPQHHRPTSKSPREEGGVCSQTPPRQIQGSQPQSLGAPQPVTFRERIGKPGPGMPHPTTVPSSALTLSSRTQKPRRRGGGLVLLPPPHPAGPEGPGCASQWAGALRPLALSRGPGGQRRKTCPFDLATPVPASALRSPVVWEASAGSCAHSPSTGSGAPPLFTFILGK